MDKQHIYTIAKVDKYTNIVNRTTASGDIKTNITAHLNLKSFSQSFSIVIIIFSFMFSSIFLSLSLTLAGLDIQKIKDQSSRELKAKVYTSKVIFYNASRLFISSRSRLPSTTKFTGTAVTQETLKRASS